MAPPANRRHIIILSNHGNKKEGQRMKGAVLSRKRDNLVHFRISSLIFAQHVYELLPILPRCWLWSRFASTDVSSRSKRLKIANHLTNYEENILIWEQHLPDGCLPFYCSCNWLEVRWLVWVMINCSNMTCDFLVVKWRV